MNDQNTPESTNPAHFIKVVTDLGEDIPLMTSQAIFNDRGIKIIDKGVAVNAALYERLTKHSLSTPIAEAVGSVHTVTGKVLREHAEQAMRDIPFFERISKDIKTRALLLDAIENIPLPGPIAFQLMLVLKAQPKMFRHSIYSALFAAWMTLDTLVSRFDIGIAAAAGLLHDLGMLHINPKLLSPHEVIDRELRRQLYSHPLVSSVLIDGHHEYSKTVVRAIREHHEFLDGSGYPRYLSELAISPLGRVLCLGELVCSLLESGQEASEIHLRVQLRMNNNSYDAKLSERVERQLKSQSEVTQIGAALFENPVAQLHEINSVVADWPDQFILSQDLSPQRREGMTAVSSRVAQLRRTLSSVGVASVQLVQLGDGPLDASLQFELSLLAQEATWQLRNLSRQTKRRWHLEPETTYPDTLQTWLDRVDALTDHG